MKRIKYIFLNVVLSLQFIFASIEIPEDSFVRAGSVVSRLERAKKCIFEVTTTKSKDSVTSTESKDSDEAAPKSKKQKTEELGLEVKNIELPYEIVADPGYDQTFKRIFAWDNPIDGIKGEDRLMSLLNSILFPDAGDNDLKIREITPLPNESTNLGEQTGVGALRFDIACRCTCYKVSPQPSRKNVCSDKNKIEKILDVKMQTGYQSRFSSRLFDYASALRLSNKNTQAMLPTEAIVVAFLNYYPKYHTSKKDESAWIVPYSIDPETGQPLEALSGLFNTHSIDLSRKSIMLKNDTPIIIGKRTISEAGKEWLKLLGIRQWASRDGFRYIIPDTAKTPEVNSAIKMLSYLTERDVQEFLNTEDFASGVIDTAKEEGKIEGLEEGKMKGKLETAKNMLRGGCDIDFIYKMTGLPIEQINALKDELEKSKEDNELEDDDDE